MTEVSVPTLADFLLARIAEDEAAARSATAGPWEWSGSDDDDFLYSATTFTGIAAPTPRSPTRTYRGTSAADRPQDAFVEYEQSASVIYASGMHTEGYLDCMPEDRAHIARWDPARVLAECEAKRRIVAIHARDYGHECPGEGEDPIMIPAGWYGSDGCRDCDVLRLLALPYASHPDYREEWRA